jgi:thymidine kinase
MSKLYARYSSMNAGKSLQLLAVKHNYEERSMKVAVYTAAIDDRYGAARVSSRVGIWAEARVFDAQTVFSRDLLDSDVACVLVDESQFLTEQQVRQLHRMAHVGSRSCGMADKGLPVMCFGLRTDFLGNPFPGAAMLMCLADDLEEIRTVCRCGKKASMNVRLAADGSRMTEGAQIEIGGNARYEAVCSRCFYRDATNG